LIYASVEVEEVMTFYARDVLFNGKAFWDEQQLMGWM
jgi:hypothetical protein